MSEPTDVVALDLFTIIVVIFMPWLIIWALNALFPVLAIPYTLKTWFAIIVVSTVLKGSVPHKKS